MKLYSGFDLHSNNCDLGVIDENGKQIFKRKLDNNPELILQTLEPFQKDLAGVVVESTYNWYWLVDLLTTAGIRSTWQILPPFRFTRGSSMSTIPMMPSGWLRCCVYRFHQGYIYPKET